jgi:hypothetical protein
MRTDPIRLLFAAIVLWSAAIAPCHAQKMKPVAPETRFELPLLELQSPAGKGWLTVDTGADGRFFMREADDRYATVAATVTFLPLEPDLDRAGFEALIREEVVRQAPVDRFEPVESSLEYDETRGYPCIRYAGVVRDTAAQVGGSRTRSLILDVLALYCRHPHDATRGFALVYSHRGPKRDPALAADATRFFATVKPTPPASPSP